MTLSDGPYRTELPGPLGGVSAGPIQLLGDPRRYEAEQRRAFEADFDPTLHAERERFAAA